MSVVKLGHDPCIPYESEHDEPMLNGRPVITCPCGGPVLAFTRKNPDFPQEDTMCIYCQGCRKVYFSGSEEAGWDYILARVWLMSTTTLTRKDFIAANR